MSLSEWSTNKISEYHRLNEETYEKVRYGFDVIYINASKTVLLFIISALIGIFQETILLLIAYISVRLTGFGYHSNNTLKCTIIGMAEFIGGTYLAIWLPPFDITIRILIYIFCILIFAFYAPVATIKRPINSIRKRYFKIVTLISTTGLFVITLFLNNPIEEKLIIVGVVLESISILPITKKIMV